MSSDRSVAEAAAAGPAATASRYGLLYSASPAVTGDSQTLLVDYITRRIGDLYATRYLTEQLRALETLELTPTARLERLMAEHLDCCTYRLDAWMSGLVSYQLASMRYRPRSASDGRRADACVPQRHLSRSVRLARERASEEPPVESCAARRSAR